jgi:hypothetical protein
LVIKDSRPVIWFWSQTKNYNTSKYSHFFHSMLLNPVCNISFISFGFFLEIWSLKKTYLKKL